MKEPPKPLGICDIDPETPHHQWNFCENWRPNEKAQPAPPSDPLGPRSAERHDPVYSLQGTNER